jgi:hypothetical protein
LQSDSLCAITTITPRIPGEIADYTFEIDLDTNKANLSTTSPNEVTIFWPYQYYGAYLKDIQCYSTGQINCSFSEEGVLNVKFPSALTIGSGKKIPFVIVGVPNPASESDLSFACTDNNYTNVTRTVLMTGSGKLSGGITLTEVQTFGNLRFLSISQPVNIPRNPREVSTHNFRVTFDTAIGQTDLTKVNFSSAPVFHVYFPKEYTLAWYPSQKATASIDEYKSDSNNVISKTTTISPSSVSQSGNRVTITFPGTSFSVTAIL